MQKFFSLLVKWPIFMGDKIEEKPQWNLSFGISNYKKDIMISSNLHLQGNQIVWKCNRQGRRKNKAAFQGKLPV